MQMAKVVSQHYVHISLCHLKHILLVFTVIKTIGRRNWMDSVQMQLAQW